MLRHLDPALLTRIKAYATTHAIPLREAIIRLIDSGLARHDQGKAHWADVTPEERSARMRKAVQTRWAGKDTKGSDD